MFGKLFGKKEKIDPTKQKELDKQKHALEIQQTQHKNSEAMALNEKKV